MRCGSTRASRRYAYVLVFGFLLIEISSRKAVPEVTSAFPGPLHHDYTSAFPTAPLRASFAHWVMCVGVAVVTDCACAANGLSCMVALSLALVVVVGFAVWSSIADSMFWLFAVVHVVSVVFGAGLLRTVVLHVVLNVL